jgi:hypothetical protein
MGKGRWLIGALLVVGAVTVGRSRMEDLWYHVSRDPLIAVLVLIILAIITVGVVRILRQ